MSYNSTTVTTNKSYTSQDRQQAIFNDINLIQKLISCHRNAQNLNKTKNTRPPNLSKPNISTLKNESSFTIKQSPSPIDSNLQQYNIYGKKFISLNYDQLLYLLCRKKVLQQFVVEFIQLKYQLKFIHNFHYKIVQNFNEILGNNSPEITLSTCINLNWIDILSKEDIFYDVMEILQSQISRNWKVNHIKVQKRQKQSSFLNENSQIFITKPNLDNITVKQPQENQYNNDGSKRVIEESTRQILTGLQQLRRQMQGCQAEMNMAKNNDSKILEKNKEYSVKQKKYNELKDMYRERMIKKEQKKLKIGYKLVTVKGENESVLRSMQQKDYPLGQSLVQDTLMKSFGGLNSKVIEEDNSEGLQPVVKPHKYQKLKSSDEDLKTIHLKKPHNQETQSIKVKSQREFTLRDYDELIQILDKVNKNETRNQRIQTLTDQQTPPQTDSSLTKSHNNHSNDKKTQPNLITSSKQQFLDKYVKKVFNHYLLEQSKTRNLSLFDSNISSSELNFKSLQKVPMNNRQGGLSPSMRKKFSVEVDEMREMIGQKRRTSLANPLPGVNNNSNMKNNIRNRMKTISSSNDHSLTPISRQPQLTLESYSKFIRAFQLATKTVSFVQIMQLFKQKSTNKKSISYNQFLELFELIYRLECSKLEIQFTAVMFDNFLKKEIFNWNKINKVLRLKTVCDEKRYDEGTSSVIDNNKTVKSKYKFSLVGHSGRLSEQIVEKINISKKPFNKMPCMNRNSTLPVATSDDMPKTRIQIKIQEMKRNNEIQKSRKAQQLQAYLTQARKKQDSTVSLKQQFDSQLQKSYVKRYRMKQKGRKAMQQQSQLSSNNNSKLINASKLKKLKSDPAQYESSLSFDPNQFLKPKKSDPNDRKRMKTLQPRYETLYREEGSPNLNSILFKGKKNANNSDEIHQLQRIIGIRESEEQDNYSDEFENDEDAYEQLGNSRSNNNSMYETIDHTNHDNSNKLRNNMGNNSKTSSNPKQKQQDEFLANYLSKQKHQFSQINYLQNINTPQEQTDSYMQDRQKWRIHF